MHAGCALPLPPRCEDNLGHRSSDLLGHHGLHNLQPHITGCGAWRDLQHLHHRFAPQTMRSRQQHQHPAGGPWVKATAYTIPLKSQKPMLAAMTGRKAPLWKGCHRALSATLFGFDISCGVFLINSLPKEPQLAACQGSAAWPLGFSRAQRSHKLGSTAASETQQQSFKARLP